MEKIVSIVEDLFLGNKALKTVVRGHKVIISYELIYSIVLRVENSNKISIYPVWKVGLIGKIIFNKTYQNHFDNYNIVRNQLLIEGYDLSEIHLIGNAI